MVNVGKYSSPMERIGYKLLETEIPPVLFCWPAGTIPNSCSSAVNGGFVPNVPRNQRERSDMLMLLRKVLSTTQWMYFIEFYHIQPTLTIFIILDECLRVILMALGCANGMPRKCTSGTSCRLWI